MTEAEIHVQFGPLVAKWIINEGRYLHKKYKVWPAPEAFSFALSMLFLEKINRNQTKVLLEDMLQCEVAKRIHAPQAD